MGGRSQTLFRAEVPGPVSTKLVPQTAHASQILYLMYFVLTGAELVALRIAGMPWFDAITTTFSCVCTAGFSVMNQSLGAYNLPACEIIAIVFMILGSLNFAVFFLVITGRARQALRSDELKFFLGILGVVSLLVFWNILPLYDTAGHALRDAVFQVTSLISTSGFSTVDYNLWPTFSQTLLLLLMFVGGCSGSTAGSIKCGRILLLLRSSTRSILRLSHPRAIKVVKLDGKAVSEETLRSVFSFFTCYFLLLGLGTIVVSLDGHSLTTSFTATLGCLSNVGPGLDTVGPLASFSPLSEFNKVFLSLFMLIGRLEIFPILLLFHPLLGGGLNAPDVVRCQPCYELQASFPHPRPCPPTGSPVHPAPHGGRHRLPGGSPPLPLYHPTGRHPRHTAHPIDIRIADFFPREGFAVVGLSWVVLSLFGALPFYFSGTFASFADCFFEIVSGFTTTGGSILTDIESMPGASCSGGPSPLGSAAWGC